MRRKKADCYILKDMSRRRERLNALYEFVEDEDGVRGPYEDL